MENSTPSNSPAFLRLKELMQEPKACEAAVSMLEVGQRGRKPVNLPNLRNPDGAALSRYAVEKMTGVRRENGALKLTRLTARHYKIIGLHLEGKSLEQVAQACSISLGTVSRVINDPLAQNILRRVYTHREEEIKALAGKAIDATREALEQGDMGLKMRAVDRFIKIRDSMLSKDTGRESAEDVIARMLENATFVNSNVQVNIGEKQD